MQQVVSRFRDAARWTIEAMSRLFVRFDQAPIDSVEGVCEFVRTRASFVTQKKLYGYLKERIGTRYPKMFDDDDFSRSINIAKMHVFAAGLSDLTIHAVAAVAAGSGLDVSTRRLLAVRCYRLGVAENEQEAPDARAPVEWVAAFEKRLEAVHWENVGAGASAFIESPKALVRWAPIADELKELDREIVENSMRFAWNEIREDFRRRLDANAVVRDCNAQRMG